MAKTESNTNGYVAALIALLLLIGVPYAGQTISELSGDELSGYYVCSLTGDIQEFKGGISGTGYTGYPNLENRKGYLTCGTTSNKGEWLTIEQYAEFIGIDPDNTLDEQDDNYNIINTKTQKWGENVFICSQSECVRWQSN
jgi:hypothetical protein